MQFRNLLPTLLCGVISAAITDPSFGQTFVDDHISPTTLQVVRVEEDWRLDVGEPDARVTAPQITTAISPQGDLSGVHAIFNLNYQALENFAPGGMQLQVWNGLTPITWYRLRPDEELQTPGERVTWTQVMQRQNDGLVFRIENGNSTTWGTFGGTNLLTEKVSTSLANLNRYDPTTSVENSGVTFAGNRVDSLVLERVRIYTSDGQVFHISVGMQVDND
jgi:hypothetical protein